MARTPTRSSSERADELKLSREVAWYLDSRGIASPQCVPAVKTPEPSGRGVYFDPERVDRVLAAFRALHHIAGRWARPTVKHPHGLPFEPDPWQVAYVIAPIFGWVRKDSSGEYVRVIRDAYIDVPRKNGKSLLASAVAVYMAFGDDEPGAQVVTAATAITQARFVFDPIRQQAERSPLLAAKVKVLAHKVVKETVAQSISVVSSVAETQHGANIHCAIVDELHVHKKPDLVEALETGRGSRRQPLLFIITTADAGSPATIYARKREYIERLASRQFKDQTTYGIVFAASDADDPFAEETMRKANPGYGVSPTPEALKAAAEKARNSPADLAAYLRLHLGIRTKQLTRYITLGAWDRNAGVVDEQKLAGATCYGGLDLASTSDMTALCWLFPDPELGGFDVLWRLWVPEESIGRLNSRTAGAADVWIRHGVLRTTPGNVTDYAFVRKAIEQDRKLFNVRSIAYDRWNASQLVTELVDDGATMVPLGQGFASLSAPLKEIQRLLLQGNTSRPLLRHGGNPVLRWMVDNLAVTTDAAGNVKPDRANARDKIDGVAALVDAMHEAIAAQAEPVSAYDNGGDLRVV